MAVIQKLRNSGIVILVIVIALLAFVISDAFNKNSGFDSARDDMNTVAEIGDDKVKEEEVMATAQRLLDLELERDPNYQINEEKKAQLFSQAWDEVLTEHTLIKEIKRSGIILTDADVNELMAGEHPVESVKGDPSFQTDGKFDPKKVEQLSKETKRNPDLRKRWNNYINQLKKQTLQNRYVTYLAKSSYISSKEREYEYIAANAGSTGKLVSINYATIPDKDIKITESDLKAYLNDHKEEFKQKEESRDMQYVTWDIIPSADDSAFAQKSAADAARVLNSDTKPDTAAPDVSAFVGVNGFPADSIEKSMYQAAYNGDINQVVGPAFVNGRWLIVQKVAEKQDSNALVHVAHVLISTSAQAQNKIPIKDSVEALAKATEVLNKARSGAAFDKLATEFSADAGSAVKGGELDWGPAGQYVPEFAKWVSTHKKGEIGLVKTQFGYHVIKVLDDPTSKQAKFRTASIDVQPGKQTIGEVDKKSRTFRNMLDVNDPKSFEKVRDRTGMVPRVMKDVGTTTRQFPGVDNADAKGLVSWLFQKDRKSNEVSDVFAFVKKHIILQVTAVRHEGYAKVEDVKEKLEPLVRNHLKAEKIRKEKFDKYLSTVKTAEELASKTGGALIQLESVKLGQNFVPQLFNEPRILGAIFGVKEKKLSKPVEGMNAIVVLWIEKRDQIQIPKTGLQLGDKFSYENQPNMVMGRVIEALRKSANIKDYRYKFEWN